MAQAARKFRIFVSSTFSDLKEERNALQQHVCPGLRELCMQRGCRFQAIDLHWGVSAEASRDQQTINICMEEPLRCQRISPHAHFIVLLSDRYGWRSLPDEIPKGEFGHILSRLTDEDKALLLWEEHHGEVPRCDRRATRLFRKKSKNSIATPKARFDQEPCEVGG
jgi:hypothetical protein